MDHLKLRGERDGATFRVKRGALHTVGRDDKASVKIKGMVDKRHAELDFRGEACLVSDAGSTSGVYLNDSIVRSPTALKAGDKLRVGSYVFLVEGYG